MEGGSSGDDDDDGDDLPSPEATKTSRLAPGRRTEGGGGSTTETGKATSVLGFSRHGINWSRGRAPEGGGPSQAASRRGQGWGRASRAPGAPLATLWPHFWYTGPSGAWIFCDFSWNFLRYLKIHFPAHNKTIQAALLKIALVRVSFVQIMQE